MHATRFGKFLVSILLLALLTGCGNAVVEANPVDNESAETGDNAVDDTEATDEVVTVSFWHTYNEESPENEMLTQTLIPIFEESHPGINIEPLTVAWPDFRQRLITSIAGGVAPDLIRADIIWVPEFAEMGALVPLDEVMSDFNDYAESVFPGPLSTNFWNGHYYGLPLDTNTKVMLQNESVLAAAGIEQTATTFEDFWAECAAAKAVDQDAYLFAADGTFAWVMLPWVWSGGGDILDEGLTTASGYINSPETVAVYQMWLDMYKAGCIAPTMLGEGIDTFSGVGQGLYGGFDQGPWAYPMIASEYPDVNLVASLFPAGAGGSIEVVGGEDVVLFEQSDAKDAAIEFIRFLLSEEYQLKMAEVGQIPVLTSAADSEYMQNHEYYGIFLQQLETARARPAHPLWQQIDDIMTDAGQMILREEMTPQAALDAAAEQIDALLGN